MRKLTKSWHLTPSILSLHTTPLLPCPSSFYSPASTHALKQPLLSATWSGSERGGPLAQNGSSLPFRNLSHFSRPRKDITLPVNLPDFFHLDLLLWLSYENQKSLQNLNPSYRRVIPPPPNIRQVSDKHFQMCTIQKRPRALESQSVQLRRST